MKNHATFAKGNKRKHDKWIREIRKKSKNNTKLQNLKKKRKKAKVKKFQTFNKITKLWKHVRDNNKVLAKLNFGFFFAFKLMKENEVKAESSCLKNIKTCGQKKLTKFWLNF